jgi:hypothetical protein
MISLITGFHLITAGHGRVRTDTDGHMQKTTKENNTLLNAEMALLRIGRPREHQQEQLQH